MLPVGSKHRRWEVFISVSASGPESSNVSNESSDCIRSRESADLRYTTADVDHLYNVFIEPELDRPRLDDLHLRLVNPSKEDVVKSIKQAGEWLEQFREHPDWDGGGIHFNYAGHGINDKGALQLNPGLFHVDEFISSICEVAQCVSSPGRLRISFVLDSCHSGAWVTRLLHACFHEHPDLIVPFNLFAACMFDELAAEDSSIGHGLFTYYVFARDKSLLSFGSNVERECAVLTEGKQNPISYWNGAGEIEISQSSLSTKINDEDFLTEDQIIESLMLKRKQICNELRSHTTDHHSTEEFADDLIKDLKLADRFPTVLTNN